MPETFRFSVKLARAFIHDARLRESGDRLRASVENVAGLGEKWGALLVQLPPILASNSGASSTIRLSVTRPATPWSCER